MHQVVTMAAGKSYGPKGLIPHCAELLRTAGLSNTDAARLADISTSSINRLKGKQPVLFTTCSKLINALSMHHFDGKKAPKLDAKKEIVRIDDLQAV